MPSVELEKHEWDQIVTTLATKEIWIIANPLIIKIKQQTTAPVPEGTKGDGAEMPLAGAAKLAS